MFKLQLSKSNSYNLSMKLIA